MFVIFAFALITASYVSAEIPSYINVCARTNPNLDQCILENIENIKDKICEGIPELGVQPSNPLLLGKIVISDNPNSKINLKDASVSGLCDFVVKFLHLELDKLHFDVNILFRQIQINGTYDFDVRLLVPIKQDGPVYITSKNVDAKVSMDMKLVTQKGKRYVFMSKMKINLDIKGYDAEYGLNSAELNRLNQVISNFIGNNQQEIIEAFKPPIEEQVVKQILSLSNNIVKHFTFEELFPEQV